MTPPPDGAASIATSERAGHSGSTDAPRVTPSGSHAIVPKPPLLASDALRKDLAPAAPAPQLLRYLLVAVGVIGAVQSLLIGGAVATPLALVFVALGALGFAPMAYPARAGAVASVAGCALAIVSYAEIVALGRVEPIVLAAGVTLLASALLFREWHRASLLARVLVLLGLVLCATFLAMIQTLQHLPIVDPAWQAWVPQVLQLVLVLLLLLSLLAFMDARSTGGGGACATAILAWYAVFRGAELLAWRYPAASAPSSDALGGLAVMHAAGPLLTAVFAFAAAQLLAARCSSLQAMTRV